MTSVAGRAAAHLTWAALAVVVLGGCAFGGPRVHSEEEGPLEVHGTGSGGGVSVYEPKAVPWRATFGFNLLCSAEPESELVLGKVRWTAREPPLKVTPVLRTVTARQMAEASRRTLVEPVFSALGSPPQWVERYADFDKPPLGAISTDVAGANIAQDCRKLEGMTAGFTELMFIVETDETGAELSGFEVDYTRDGRPHTLVVDYTMTLCGTRIRENCDGSRE